MVKIKNCGLKTPEAVQASVESGADYIGFVLHAASPRYVTASQAATLASVIPASVQTVAVLVAPSLDTLDTLLKDWKPNLIQLHGAESPETVATIRSRYGLPIIKAMGISSTEDLAQAAAYDSVADFLMFDAKSAGAGVPFDWSLLQNIFGGSLRPQPTAHTPWFLAGGLNIDNIKSALALTAAPMIDVSSGLERERGVKDPAKITAFNQFVRQLAPHG